MPRRSLVEVIVLSGRPDWRSSFGGTSLYYPAERFLPRKVDAQYVSTDAKIPFVRVRECLTPLAPTLYFLLHLMEAKSYRRVGVQIIGNISRSMTMIKVGDDQGVISSSAFTVEAENKLAYSENWHLLHKPITKYRLSGQCSFFKELFLLSNVRAINIQGVCKRNTSRGERLWENTCLKVSSQSTGTALSLTLNYETPYGKPLYI